MNPNHNNFIPDDRDTFGFAAVEKATVQEVRFTERVQSFEQCCTSGAPGAINFLRVAAADLFRTIPIVERDAVDELRQAFENPSEHNHPALRQYVRTLQVLRGWLQASVALETQTQSSEMTFQSQKTKRDQS
jgi:hypothetical protein